MSKLSHGSSLVLLIGHLEKLKSYQKKFIENEEVSNLAICKISNLLECVTCKNYNIEVQLENSTDEILLGRREIIILKRHIIKEFLEKYLDYHILMCVEKPTEYWDRRRKKKVKYKYTNITFPGGKRKDPNENPLMCAQRELSEETGIHNITLECFKHQRVCKYNHHKCTVSNNSNGIPLWMYYSIQV